MRKVEQHIISQNDTRWTVIDAACFLSKNLYNAALYDLRQHFFATDKSKSYHQLDKEMNKRNRQVNHFLHSASRTIIAMLVKRGIGTLVIGKNDGWKQDINIGKRNNQNFVQIPHARFIEILAYKAEEQGIVVILTEETYTSKCSLLDNEPIHKHENYVGKRVKRGLFQSSEGRFINADINGAGNMIRKVVPNAFADGIEALVVAPLRVAIPA